MVTRLASEDKHGLPGYVQSLMSSNSGINTIILYLVQTKFCLQYHTEVLNNLLTGEQYLMIVPKAGHLKIKWALHT